MKKVLLFLALLALLLFAGCGVPEAEPEPGLHGETELAPSPYGETADTDSGLSLRLEYPEYAPGMERLTYILSNDGDSTTPVFGSDYGLEALIDGAWYTVPFVENAAWTGEGYELAPGGDIYMTLWLGIFDYPFPGGVYRLVKKVGDQVCLAEFRLGPNGVSPEAPYGYAPLDKLPQDYDAATAEADGVVVMGHDGSVVNRDRLEHFLANVTHGANAMARLLRPTKEGDPIITDIVYENDCFILTVDDSRDDFAAHNGEPAPLRYAYLITDGSQLYLSDHAAWEYHDRFADAALYEWLDTTAAGLPELAGQVEELTQRRIAGNITRYKVWNDSGAYFAATEGLEFAVNRVGSGWMDAIDPKSGATEIVYAAWLSEDVVTIVCATDSPRYYHAEYAISSQGVITDGYAADFSYDPEGGIVFQE